MHSPCGGVGSLPIIASHHITLNEQASRSNEGSGPAGEPPAGAGDRGASGRHAFDPAHHLKHPDGDGRGAAAPLGDRPRHFHQRPGSGPRSRKRARRLMPGAADSRTSWGSSRRRPFPWRFRSARARRSWSARARSRPSTRWTRSDFPRISTIDEGPCDRAGRGYAAAHDRSGGVRSSDRRLASGDHGREHQE